jgi:hypothetical protein
MSEINDFIYINDDALPEEKCNEIVDYVTKNKKNNFEKIVAREEQDPTWDRNSGKKQWHQDDFFFHVHQNMGFPKNHIMNFQNTTHNGLEEYHIKYPTMPRGLRNPYIKYHIVHQGGGYHVWHQEWSPSGHHHVILVWHLSLTSHENEGELEFLNYGRRISPKAGRLTIWPAYFTHMHRGNPIRTKDTFKHYVTGWWHINLQVPYGGMDNS